MTVLKDLGRVSVCVCLCVCVREREREVQMVGGEVIP